MSLNIEERVDCLAPTPVSPATACEVPAGAWDTHAHVIGGAPEYPFVANRSYTPPRATVEQYLGVLDTIGIRYGVIVPISVHGADNRLLLSALRKHPGRLRGIASIDGSESDVALHELRAAGVCGIRINELFAGGAGADVLQQLAARCRPLGWHLDLALHGSRIRELLPVLLGLDVPLVVDHMGFCRAERGVHHPDFQAVVELVRRPGNWVKLSGAYRLTAEGPPYGDVARFMRALYEAAAERCVWAADWPHVALRSSEQMPQAGALLDFLARHLPDAAAIRRVLVDNPLRLYGAPGSGAPGSGAPGIGAPGIGAAG